MPTRRSAAVEGEGRGGGGRKMRARKITWLVTAVDIRLRRIPMNSTWLVTAVVVVYVVCWLPYWIFQVIMQSSSLQLCHLEKREMEKNGNGKKETDREQTY